MIPESGRSPAEGKWQPTPVFLPGESQGRGMLVGYCLWGRRGSDTTEVTQQQQQQWVLPYIDMNQPWVYMCSPSRSPLPPSSRSHPSGSSQCTSSEQPVSWIEPGLVIYFTYGHIHVSVLFSNHPTLGFSHRVQKSVLYIYVSFAVLRAGSSLLSF